MPDALDQIIPIKNNVFIVQNITPDRNKTIHLFQYPIPYLKRRDLLQIPGVDEAVIKDSLMRGVLKNRILNGDIAVISSDISLVQYNLDQKAFLEKAGMKLGANSMLYKHRVGVPLEGEYNGLNRKYKMYNGEKFVHNPTDTRYEFNMELFHNGKLLSMNDDYILKESGGVGTGYDEVRIVFFSPDIQSNLTANYYIVWQ